MISSLGKLIAGAHFRQLLAYGLSVGGTMAAGFALVLILVRIVPAEDYGGLVLAKALLLVIIALAGMGLSQAAVRWCVLPVEKEWVLGTVCGGAALTALPAASLLIILIMVLTDRLKMAVTLPLVAAIFVLVISYIINNELVNWLRARHQAKRHALVSTVRAVLQLISVSIGVLLLKNAAGYVYGLAAGELLMLLWLGYGHLASLQFNQKLLKEMLLYGWPHTFVIASGFILNYADRYMLSFLTNNNSMVAYYDAASMVVVSALALLIRPFNLYLFPVYTKCFKEEGQDATIRLINRSQRLFLVIGLGVATVVVALREPILKLLYPADYMAASSIFSAIAFGTLLNGVFIATVAGFYVSHRTIMVGFASVVAVISNMMANWWLIPIYGIDGAALGTVIGNLVQLVIGYYFSYAILPVKFPLGLLVGGGAWLALVNFVTK